MHWYMRSLLLEIVVQCRFELRLVEAKFRGQQSRVDGRVFQADDYCALFLQGVDRLCHDLVHFFIFRSATKQVRKHTKPCALQSVLQERGVGFWNIADTKSGYGIVWIVADHSVQKP